MCRVLKVCVDACLMQCECVNVFMACVAVSSTLDRCRNLLPSVQRGGGELLGVPASLLVHEPGVPCPHKHVEVAEHLEE